jgi:RNA polymerase sigma-70 factor, ECF subfamily
MICIRESAIETTFHATEPKHMEDLVAAARLGSPVAFEELRRICGQRIYRSVLSITKNQEDAEDALQDAFLRAYKALPRFEQRCSFSTWMTRIAINSALMILRKRRSRCEVPLDSSSEDRSSGLALDLADSRPGPEAICVDRQKYASMIHCISRLRPGTRKVLEMRAAHSASVKEIARTVGISEAAVKSRLARGRKLLSSDGVKLKGSV